ncbi:MAG: HEAT repeat domain-containing protein [Armatimonadota bacterium]|nr:HEAT repeat domain-containing protein [bacterium]
MNEDQIIVAAWDLVSDDKERSVEGYKILKEAGGSSTAILLQTAHQWDELQQARWLGIYAGGSPTDFLAHAINDPRAIDALADGLHDPECHFRSFAAFALAEIDDPRVAGLLAEAIRDEEPEVRQNAIYGLQRQGDERSFVLVTAAMNDADERVCSAAARAMRWIGGVDSTQVLILALSDPAERVAASAAGSLGVLAITEAVDSLIEALHSERGNLAKAAADALGNIGDSHAVTPLIDILKTTDNLYVRSSAARALIKLAPEQAIEPLIAMLRCSDHLKRNLAAGSLGTLRDSRAADSLVKFLSDDDPGVARSAAFALASIGDQRAIDPLLALLQIEPRMQPIKIGINPDVYRDEDMNRHIRNAAAKALGKLGDTWAIEPLATTLGDASVARTAASSLAQLGDERGVRYLLNVLRSGDKQQVCSVVQALGESKSPNAVMPLMELLTSEATSSSMRSYVLSALARIGTQKAVEAVESVMILGDESAIDAAAELAKLGHDSGFAYLGSELKSGNEKQRTRVVMKLHFISHPHAVDLLVLALRDRSSVVRLYAVRALGKIGDKSSIESLEALLNGKNRQIRVAASTSIRRLKIRCARE